MRSSTNAEASRRLHRRLVAAGAAVLVLALLTPAQAEKRDIFVRLAGSWAGSGRANVSGGEQEPIRCRADYQLLSRDELSLELRCATDSFRIDASGRVQRSGNQLSGTWSESTTGISGNVTGTIGPNFVDATVDGGGVGARLQLTLRGSTQVVTLATQSASASVLMQRQ